MRRQVTEHSNLIRDETTNAILSTDYLEYQNYLNTKRKKTKDDNKIQTLENDVASIRNDLDEIKQLLKNLSNGSE